MGRVFEAKYGGECGICGKRYEGDRITKDLHKEKAYDHADCAFPFHLKGNGSSEASAGKTEAGSFGSSFLGDENKLAESVESRVADNMSFGMKLAMEKLKTNADEMKAHPEYLAFAVEAARERHSLMTMECI